MSPQQQERKMLNTTQERIMRKTPDKASHSEVIRCHKVLEKVIVQQPDGGCEYVSGNSDQTVAEELGIAPATVAHIRKQMFGLLRVGRVPSATDDDRIVELIAHVNELTNRFNKLVTAISLNRGSIDVRHLFIPEMSKE